MAMKIKIGAISGKTWQEGDLWFSMTDKLPIAGYGKTPEESMNRAMCALRAYLDASIKDNALSAMAKHYKLLVERESEGYNFSIETPIGERRGDLVLS